MAYFKPNKKYSRNDYYQNYVQKPHSGQIKFMIANDPYMCLLRLDKGSDFGLLNRNCCAVPS